MKSAKDLRQLLETIDHRGYPAYKETAGAWRFENYVLGIDHVQGDPFAAPSRLHVEVAASMTGIPAALYDTREKKTALEDHLLRRFYARAGKFSFLHCNHVYTEERGGRWPLIILKLLFIYLFYFLSFCHF